MIDPRQVSCTLTGVCDEPDVDGGVVRRGVAGVGAVVVEGRREAHVAHLQPHDLGWLRFTYDVRTVSGVLQGDPSRR